MAKTKTGKTTKGSRQPRAKRLGVKIYGEQRVKTGQIIIRQKGSTFHAGRGVDLGKDFTLFATCDGKVKFYEKRGKKYVAVAASS